MYYNLHMSKTDEKKKAIELRKKGKSIKEISETLHVSRGSVSVWCRDVILSQAQRKKLKDNMVRAGHKGRLLGAEMNKRKKMESKARESALAEKLLKNLDSRDRFLLGIGLYWGEGAKTDGSAFAIVNSDPILILFMKDWFEEFFEVSESDLNPYIYISEQHYSRKKEIICFWSKTLRLPKRQCSKVIFLKGRPKKLYENRNSYYGILALRVRKSSHLKYRMLGLIEATKRQILPG